MIEVQRSDVVALAPQPEESCHAVRAHRNSQVVWLIFGQDLLDDFDHVGNSPRTKILSPSSVGTSIKQIVLARSEVVSGSMIE